MDLPWRLRAVALALCALLGTLGACALPGVNPTATPEEVPTAQPVEPSGQRKEGGKMALTLVYDNHARDPNLEAAWGFAAWLEYGGHTVLFDTGRKGSLLLDNMAKLGLDPQDVESVVLSHAHGDHTGGLAALLETNSAVTVYLPQAFPASIKDRVRATGAKVVEVSDPFQIRPGLWSTGQMGTGIVEQALVVKTVRGLVMVTGCAHPGIDEMATRAAEIGQEDLYLVAGGFHLTGASLTRIEEIISRLQRLGVEKVAPCHCTGDKARASFERAFGADYEAAGVGWHISLDLSPTGGQMAAIWQSAGHGIPGQLGIAAVAVAPSDPTVVYLAAYEPGGLYRSTDGGDSWRAANGGLGSVAPLSLVVDPAHPQRAWIGTMAGGYRTSDGGQNWQSMTGLGTMPVYALASAPDGVHLYAGGEEPGLWHSDDGGQTWSNRELGSTQAPVLSLAVAKDGSIAVGTAGQGIWISRNGGETWQKPPEALTSAHVTAVRALDDGVVYGLADSLLALSRDGGRSWQFVGPPEFAALSFVVQLGSSERLYVGSGGRGLALSEDGGQSWTILTDDFAHADITCLVADPGSATVAYAGTRHNGLFRTLDGGRSWQLVTGDLGTPVIAALAQDPVHRQILYAGTLDGVYRSQDGGEHWQSSSSALGTVYVQALEIDPAGERVYAGTPIGIYTSEDGGSTWRWAEADTAAVAIFSIQVDPHDSRRIYAGSWGHNVLRSTNGGLSWAPIHHGLETLSVYTFAVDPADPQRLYAGTVEAVYRSTDHGETWRVSPLSDRPLTTFALVVDPVRPATIFAGATDGVYRSTDRGQTWQAAGRGSLDTTVTTLRMDPADPLTLYAGTEHHGLYRSTDGGQQWQRWGLEGTSVYALLVDHAGALWAGTDRGLFKNP